MIRKSAAEQLGEVQKLHPYELNNLLSKVHTFLHSTNWETRIAAGQAVDAIAKNVPLWNKNIKQDTCSGYNGESPVRLLFSQFDIGKVLNHSASLLGSEEKQYESDVQSLDNKELLSHQRLLLNRRLGLDMAGNLKLGIEGDIFTEEDLVIGIKKENGSSSETKKSVSDVLKQQLLDVTSGLSAREKSRCKRKAKLLAKQRSKDCQSEQLSFDAEPPSKKPKSQLSTESENSDKIVVEASFDNSYNIEEDEEWPFESFCELLMNDLFHSSWETRHGAATALREVIKQHGQAAGMNVDIPVEQLHTVNQLWLSDLALRLLCVLALDRFGDFVSDEVVAPVRETCAQTLGAVIKNLDQYALEGVVHVLLQLLSQSQWEVRHGGLLGFKYLLAIRQDMIDVVLPSILPSLFLGLQDVDDDVRAVAAAALVPVAENLVRLLPDKVPVILDCLWATLLDLDDLTASTNSIMTLLSTILVNPKANILEWMSRPLQDLVPRLWPFLRHSIPSVRLSTLETLHALLSLDDSKHPVAGWLPYILQDTLRHIYQRSLLEEKDGLLRIVEKVWIQLLAKTPPDHLISASVPWLGVWFCLCMQPTKIPFDPTYMIEAKHRGRPEGDLGRVRHSSEYIQKEQSKEERNFIGGTEMLTAVAEDRDTAVLNNRTCASRLLGRLCSAISEDVINFPPEAEKPMESIAKLIVFHLSTKSAIQRFVSAQILYNYALFKKDSICPKEVKTKLMDCLNEAIYFDEIAISFTQMQSDCKDFLAGLRQHGIDLESVIPSRSILSLDQAKALTTSLFDQVKGSLRPKVQQTFDDRRKQLKITVDTTFQELQTFTVRVQCSLAKAVVELDALPEKLNPVVRPLMDSLKKEHNPDMQLEAAECLCRLIRKCLDRNPSPNAKVLGNLCTFLCGDTQQTPIITQPIPVHCADESDIKCDECLGIITLSRQQKLPESNKQWSRRGNIKVDTAALMSAEIQESQRQLLIQRRGAEFALSEITKNFSQDLSSSLPLLWDHIQAPLFSLESGGNEELSTAQGQELVNSLQVLETVCPVLHSSLLKKVMEKLHLLCQCLKSTYTAVRHMAARCVAALGIVRCHDIMEFVVEEVTPLLGASDRVTWRQGGMEAVANVIDTLGVELLPYIVLLVVHVLGRMSDQNEAVRLMATHCFASLIRLMPLEAGIPDPVEMKASLVEAKEKERKFLDQLIDGSNLENYKVCVPIMAELRKYQQDGVDWLAFMNKYSLHGILCDDMGLGKTLQSICILASDHFIREEKFKETKSVDSSPLPSIVVCPPTLIGHWVYEVNKFVDTNYLNPLMYAGPPSERIRLQKKAKKHNLIVASYDVLRNDIEFFGSVHWNYCILDEGHIIKNGKTKLSKAVKQLNCNHRLILSGTPIQNNVLDLWSLFDFLMPGFLGTEKQFQVRYGKPILQSRDAKSTSKEQEAGALAMESLHRQVLPFILRRLKEDVLHDLPPKIIQNYYCDLSSLQIQLYEDFAKSRAKQGIEETVTSYSDEQPKEKKNHTTTHVFQALQYLRKLCNHPALVLTPNHPKYTETIAQLKKQNSNLRDIQHAPKLNALKQLLLDCGIGVTSPSMNSGQSASEMPVVNQHRVLLFCQLKSMLNIVEQDLLKAQMPSVTYSRLDGSVPAALRYDIVNKFNNDPSIDILLLTTHVGGLGLNLTGADTVIFVEHDWNPMKDLQAMDRAHRIGQKKVVNVYRLITRGTLEEKIMGMQNFKLTIANTVISADNSSLQTMGTDQLLDLFTLDEMKSSKKSSGAMGRKENAKSIIENLEELWDEKDYESEYNLASFLQSLQK
ncbi:hypothetical protein FSP39_016028 [Pinctada imbricata]|uniref:TATA-binding protein-associated factor 172 n=1 Tax=Pinctada imbricata TaxID=66713 RepID=A0AA89BU59_PINIB|nr:hypothetical protein FSP39_016028 [Pinctada imbricata]